MAIGNSPLFLDLDKGRIGSFCKSGMSEAGKLFVEYQPINDFRRHRINGLMEGSLVPIQNDWGSYPGTFQMYWVLIRGEGGRSSVMLEERINSMVPKLLKEKQEWEAQQRTREAAYRVQRMLDSKGVESVLQQERRKRAMMSTPQAMPIDKKKRTFFGRDTSG